MRPLPALIAAAGLAVTALAAASPAEAAFHLIRWQGNGFCQVWDESIPTTPWPVRLHHRVGVGADLHRGSGAEGRPDPRRHLHVLTGSTRS